MYILCRRCRVESLGRTVTVSSTAANSSRSCACSSFPIKKALISETDWQPRNIMCGLMKKSIFHLCCLQLASVGDACNRSITSTAAEHVIDHCQAETLSFSIISLSNTSHICLHILHIRRKLLWCYVFIIGSITGTHVHDWILTVLLIVSDIFIML